METAKINNNPEELKEQIRAIKEEIQRIKDHMEQPGRDLKPVVAKEDLDALHFARKRLAQAKEALQSFKSCWKPLLLFEILYWLLSRYVIFPACKWLFYFFTRLY